MNKRERLEKDKILPSKPEKPKGLVTLGRSTFIDEILRKAESQSSVGPRIVAARHLIEFLQAAGPPAVANAKIHSKTEGIEHSFQDTENSQTRPSQEGNSCNLCEGEGETGNLEIKLSKPRSPEVVTEQRTPCIPNQGSVVRTIPASCRHPRNNSPAPKIPEEY